MASSFSDLGIELMATGENAGTWGTKTNTNLQIVEKAIAGYVEQAVTSGGTTALSITDGDATESTSVARHAVIKLTGTITGNSIVTVPDSIEKVYIVVNGTSGSSTVQFKTASGTGVTFGASDKSTKLLFSDGTNIVDTNFSGATDLDGGVLTLDADADTTITADTDDQIDIAIAGADDFRFTANTFTALSGSSVVIPDGGLTLGSTAVTSTAAELNILDGVTATTSEINLIDGGTSRGTTAVANGDGFLHNDGGTMRMTNVSKLADLFAGTNITASSSVLSVADAADDTKGVVELATAAEVITGTDAARVVTADTLSAKSVVCDIDVSSLTDQNIVTITHNLGTADIIVQVYDKTTEANIMCDIARTDDDFSTASTSKVSIDFGTAPPNDCRALITSLAGATAGSIAYT